MENGETGVVLDETAFYPGGGLIENDGVRVGLLD